jgi:putative effector of murein hydrolase
MVGAISGKYIFDWFGIGRDSQGWMQRGFALGTAAHGIGAARAMQVHPDAGAYAGLALAMQVLLASVLIPLGANVVRTFFPAG